MKDDKCIFCKIANGEIPSVSPYEDEDFKVIFDLNPASRGHALILPKEHFADLYELDDETASRVLTVAKKVTTVLKEELGCDGYNLVQNNGEAAGQTVFHFHMHMIPRYKSDKVNITWEPGTMDKEDMENLAEKIG